MVVMMELCATVAANAAIEVEKEIWKGVIDATTGIADECKRVVYAAKDE